MDNKSPEAFRTISEVAEWLGVPTHVLRFWESRFGQVKPVKRAGGRRYYRPSDMELLGGIRKLLHDDGMTIRGVQKLLRDKGVRHVAALSPPIDQPADMQLVDTAEVFESGEPGPAEAITSAPMFDDSVEDAELVEETDVADVAADHGAGRAHEAADAHAHPAEMFAVAAGEPGRAPSGAGLASMFATDTDPAEVDASKAAEAALPPVSLPEPEPDDADGALPGPTEMDFFAHEAIPESHESEPGEAAAAARMFAEPPAEPAAESAAEPAAEAVAEPAAEPVAEAPVVAADAGAAPRDAAPLLVWEEVPEEPAAAPTGTAPQARKEKEEPEPETAVAAAPAPAEDLHAALTLGPEARVAPPPTPEPEPAPEAEAVEAAAALAATDGGPEATLPQAPPLDAQEEVQPDAVALARALVHAGATPAPAPAAATAAAAGEPAAARPALPEIAPDPEDDAAIDELPLALSTRLRRACAGAGGGRLHGATLQAYADRLGTLSDRMGRAPDHRRSF